MLSDNVWVCGGGGAAVGGRLVALTIWSMHAENWYLAKNTHTNTHKHSEVTTTTLHLAFKLKTKGRDNVIHVHVLSLTHIGCWYLPRPLSPTP